MRALIQRVSQAAVTVGGERVDAIERGLCVFVGVTHGDRLEQAALLARRIWHLRIFEDGEGRANLSAEELSLPVLVVSQFTLYADTSRGRRPSFVHAASPEEAEPLVDAVADQLNRLGAQVASGRFRTSMQVSIVNDGPFTILLET